MPSQEDILGQEELLAAYRQTLRTHLRQRATLSTAYTPPGVLQGIAEARANIRRIKSVLRNWGVVVDDHPDDEELAFPQEFTKLTPSARRYMYPIILVAGLGLVIFLIILLRPVLSGSSSFIASPSSTISPTMPSSSSQAIVCVTSKTPGTPAKILKDTLEYFPSNPPSKKELLLGGGQVIPFSNMKGFIAIGIDNNTGGVQIEITLVDNSKVTDVVQYSQYANATLQGSTALGKFELLFQDVKSVDFLGQ